MTDNITSHIFYFITCILQDAKNLIFYMDFYKLRKLFQVTIVTRKITSYLKTYKFDIAVSLVKYIISIVHFDRNNKRFFLLHFKC